MRESSSRLQILLIEADPFASIDPYSTGKLTEAQVQAIYRRYA
jgi:hypothetical protein